MNGYPCVNNVFKDALVSGGFPPLVMFRLQTIDRHHHIEFIELFPGARNHPEGTRDHLRMHSTALHLWQKQFKLPVAHEWVASYQGSMKRFVLVDDRANSCNQVISPEIGELAAVGSSAW